MRKKQISEVRYKKLLTASRCCSSLAVLFCQRLFWFKRAFNSGQWLQGLSRRNAGNLRELTELIRHHRNPWELDGILDASKVGWSLSLPRAGHVGDPQSERVDI